MSNNSGGKFRKKINFSMVSNDIIRNDNISLKAKGLYALIQSYITLDDFILYKGFLLSKCKEGKKAFDSAWRELKESGYLIQYQMQDPETKQFYWEYELVDVAEKPCTPNRSMDSNSHNHKKDTMASGIYREKDAMAFGGTNNTIKKNTYTKEYLSNHIVSEADVMKQIGYEHQMHDDFIENIALLMAEVFNMPDDAILKINQIELSARIVKERFRKVRYKHLEYIKLVFQDFTGEITSMKNYMLTTIYNAPATCDIYFTHRVNRDQYKDSSHQIA